MSLKQRQITSGIQSIACHHAVIKKHFFLILIRNNELVLSESVYMSNQTVSLDNNSGPYLLSRTLYPKDLIIGAVSLVGTFILFGVTQSREPRLARVNRQYPPLVPVAVLGLAVLMVHALGSILVFLWGVTMPLAGRSSDS